MDRAGLLEIAERERRARTGLRIRACTAAGCLAIGSGAVKRHLDESVAEAGLRDRVQVSGVGCLRLCSQGPLVRVDPEGTLYEKVTPEDSPAIVAELAGGGVREGTSADRPRRGDPGCP